MKKALFNPVDVKKWFVVGFTAFLARLTDCHGSGGTGQKGNWTANWDDILYFPQRAWDWLALHPAWAVVVAFGVLLLFVLAVLIAWSSSRGKFMFLDNVVHDRSQVRAPWNEYRMEGNSLFYWSFILGVIVILILIGYLIHCFTTLQVLREGSEDWSVLIMPAIVMLLGLFAILLVKGFIDLLLHDFVVPIMYKDRIATLTAIRKFFPLFRSKLPHFLGYALFVFFVFLIVMTGIIVIGFGTCCVGFVLVAIPYISSVVLLPISYTLRAFSVEFLEQFGPEYHIFSRQDTTPTNAGPMIV